jgi:hypothetical protein
MNEIPYFPFRLPVLLLSAFIGGFIGLLFFALTVADKPPHPRASGHEIYASGVSSAR